MKRILQTVISMSLLLLGLQGIAQWDQQSNGGGGAFQDIHFDQNKPGRVWACSDVDGAYTSDNYGANDWVTRSATATNAFALSIETRRDYDKIFMGTINGAEYTTYDGNNNPGEWLSIPDSRGVPIATIAISKPNLGDNNKRVIVLGPSWHNKESVIKGVNFVQKTYASSASRNVLISRDGGVSFDSIQYEPLNGYRHVYNAAIDDDGVIYLGTSAGVYLGTWSQINSEYDWKRIPNPAANGSTEGGRFYNPEPKDGRPNQGGCTGLSLSPDGTRIFASYQMEDETFNQTNSNGTITEYTQPTFAVFSATTTQLKNTNFAQDSWINISSTINTDTIYNQAKFLDFHEPVVDTWASSGNNYTLLIGAANKANKNTGRQGVWRGEVQFNADGTLSDTPTWQKIVDKNNNKVAIGQTETKFNFDIGWEDRDILSRSYEVSPNFETFVRKYAAIGGQNLFIGNPTTTNFPYAAQSWKQEYTKKVSEEAYEDKGITNVVVYDVKQLGNFMIQATADNGIMESIDNGRTWNKKSGPIVPQEPGGKAGLTDNTTAVSILTFPNKPAVIIADGRALSFGVPNAFQGTLFAYTSTEAEGSFKTFTINENWKKIGGSSGDKFAIKPASRGYPSGLLRAVVQAETNRERVYVSVQGKNDLKGGIFITETINTFIDADVSVKWKKITPDSFDSFNIDVLFADPINDNIIWFRATGKGLFKGIRDSNGDYTFENADFKLPGGLNNSGNPRTQNVRPDDIDIYLGPDNKTWGLLAATAQNSREQTRVYINRDMEINWNNLESWEDTGINAQSVISGLTSIPTDWIDDSGEFITDLSFSSVNGINNTLIVSLASEKQRRGLGIFKGELTLNNDNSIDVDWTDWTGNMYNSRFRGAGFTTNGNATYFTGGTSGLGVWRRLLNGTTPPIDPEPTTGITHLRFTATGSVNLEPRIKEIRWFIGETEYPEIKVTPQATNITATTDQNGSFRVYDGRTNGGWIVGSNYPESITIALDEAISTNPDKLEISVNAINRNLSGFTCSSSIDGGVTFTQFYEISALDKDFYTLKVDPTPELTITEFNLTGENESDPEPTSTYQYLRFIPTGSVALEPRLKELKWFVGSNEYPNPKVDSNSNLVTATINQNDSFRVYDNLTNGGWLTSTSFPQSVTIDLLESIEKPDRLEINVNAINRNFSGFECWGSSDGITFEKFYEISGLTTADYDSKITSFNLISATALRTALPDSIQDVPNSAVSSENSFVFYPNPSNDKVIFNENVTLTIYNAQGLFVNTYDNVQEVDVVGLKPGIYFMVYQNGQTAKLIVN